MTAVKQAAPKKAATRKKAPAKKAAAVKKKPAKKVVAPIPFHQLSVEDRFRQSFSGLFEQLEDNYDFLGLTPVRLLSLKDNTYYSNSKIHLYLTEQPTERLVHVGQYGGGISGTGSSVKTGIYKLHTPTVLYAVTYATRNSWRDICDVQFSITFLNSKNRPLVNILPHVYTSRAICLGAVPLMGFKNKSYGSEELYTRMNPESLFQGTTYALSLYWSQGFKYGVDHITPATLNKIRTVIKDDSPKNLMQLFVKYLGDEPVDWDSFPTVKGRTFGMTVPNSPDTRVSVPVKGSFKRVREDLDQLELSITK